MDDVFSKYFTKFKYLVVGILTVFLGWLMIESLSWRMMHDSPILLYIAFLVDKFDYIPYKDIFDMNLPGTYFLYYLIGKLSNYSDFGFRIADLIFLLGIIGSTWFWLSRINRLVALYAPVVFGLTYLSLGPPHSLQREYMLILLLSLTLSLTISSKAKHNIAFLVNGFLCGFSLLVKPHSVIFYISVFVYQVLVTCHDETRSKILRKSGFYIAGFTAPLIIAFVYLFKNNAIASFIDGLNYLSLYGKLTGERQTIDGLEQIKYILVKFITLGGFAENLKWLLPSFLGIFAVWRYGEFDPERKKIVYLIMSLTACATIYPTFSGQFWLYHYLLFLYFAIILSSFLVLPQLKLKKLPQTASFVLFAVVLSTQIYYISYYFNSYKAPPENGFIDWLASGIQQNIGEGESIQPLDWTAGAIHAMLIAKRPIATPFIYDFHFYHHVSNPYIQKLRKRFIREMEDKKPTYVIKVKFDRVFGEDTTREFPDLDTMINNQYEPAVTAGKVGVIYRRK